MHYHLEIIMPKRDNVKAAVEEIIGKFSESANDGYRSFWDWWQIGGRYSGCKLEAIVGQEKIDKFYAELKSRGVTVSGVTFGKQELSPASQIEMVDALWREMCPGGGDVCPIFKHSGESSNTDICEFKDIPANLRAFRFIVAAPDYEGKKLEAVTMYAQNNWNGVCHEDTKWDGTVASAIKAHTNRINKYNPDYATKITPQADWFCVTVDYHS